MIEIGPDDSALQLGRPSSVLLRQCSGNEQRECFCSDPVGNDASHDIRLSCRCLIHRSCLVSYLRSQLGDRIQLFAAMESAGQVGIICPYARANQCNAIGNESFITLDDMKVLVLKTSPPVAGIEEALPEESLLPDEIDRFSRWIAEEKNSKNPAANASSEEAGKEKAKKDAKAKEKEEIDMTDIYIAATTKSCPSCQFRVTHWHGHSCHHIQPSAGCPKCKVPFCYKCLQPGPANQKQRGSANKCLCGGWSNFCCTSDVPANLVLAPYPYDKRCGCFICPDCEPRKPCGTCTGHCVVCLGYVKPGPREINTDWVPSSSYSAGRSPPVSAPVIIDPVTELFAACQAADVTRILSALSLPNAASVNSRDNLQRTPLFYAVDRGNVECVSLLLNVYQADASVSDSSRNTPLHHAAEIVHVEISRLLLTHARVNVNAVNNQGVSALHTAIAHNATELFQLLVTHGANVTAIDGRRRSPLHIACEHGSEDIVRLLVREYHANISTLDNQGKLALHHAASQGSVMSTLQLVEAAQQQFMAAQLTSSTATASAAVSSSDTVSAETASSVAKKLHKFLVTKDIVGKIPLHYAVIHSRVEVVNYLLEQAPESIFVTTGIQGKTMLLYAAAQSDVAILEAVLSARAKVPTRKKLATGLKGFFGYTSAEPTEDEITFINQTVGTDTALFVALENQHYDVARCLIDHGCYLHDAYGILVDACRRGDEPMMLTLLDKRAVPISLEEAKIAFPPSTLINVSNSRIVRDNKAFLGIDAAASTNTGKGSESTSGCTLLHAACLKPQVLALLLRRTDLPVHSSKLSSRSSSSSSLTPKVEQTKKPDKAVAAMNPLPNKRSPLQMVLEKIVEDPPTAPRTDTGFNPFAAFGRWLFGMPQAPTTNNNTATQQTQEQFTRRLQEYNQQKTDALASLQLMFTHRGQNLRLQDLSVLRYGSLYEYLWEKADADVALWRDCLRNEVTHHGLRFPAVLTDNSFQQTMLYQLCRRDKDIFLRILIEEFELSVNVIVQASHQQTLLHYAAEHGKFAVVELLVNLQANVHVCDHARRQPLHVVKDHRSAKCLVEKGKANVRAVDAQRCMPIHYAAKNNLLPLVEYYLSKDMRRRNSMFSKILDMLDHVFQKKSPPSAISSPTFDSQLRNVYYDVDIYETQDAHGFTAYDYALALGAGTDAGVKRIFTRDKQEIDRVKQIENTLCMCGLVCMVLLFMYVVTPGIFGVLHSSIRGSFGIVWSLLSVIISLLFGALISFGCMILSIIALKEARVEKGIAMGATIVLGMAIFAQYLKWRFFVSS